MSYQLRSSNVEFRTHLNPSLPPTELDPHQVQQVFINLINNARQAMEAHQSGGCLDVFTEFSGSRVRVIFKDNGPGITPENLKKIFNPFFTTKAVGSGTGLGLSLCYGIISEHGGTITPSSNPGEGATFTIELPVSNGTVTKLETNSNSGVGVKNMDGIGKRVIVIDDEDAIVQMISEVLTNQGYKVDVAMDGDTALKKISQSRYDLALCDWRMPGVNGRQVYERLEQNKNDISHRFIFITGDVVNEHTQEFLKSRNKQCISKPFTLEEFSSAIGKVTGFERN
jgi:two-component system NtrC family sensor kinase